MMKGPAFDALIRSGRMMMRLGVLGAIVLGVAMYMHFMTPEQAARAHAGFGLLIAGGILISTLRHAMIGYRFVPFWIGLALSLVSAYMGLDALTGGGFSGWSLTHAVLMLLAVGMVEMGAAKARKAA